MTRDQLLLAAVDTYFPALHACDTALLDETFTLQLPCSTSTTTSWA